MTSIIGLIPPVCSCGIAIGRLQQKYEENIKTMSYQDALKDIFEGHMPKSCCLLKFYSPNFMYPDDAMTPKYVDNRNNMEIIVEQSIVTADKPYVD